jgi:L-threonylcarbamoyladenylate synthase
MPIVSGHDASALALAGDTLAAGGQVAIPTETVYGLAARADDDAAVAGIFSLKGRPADHPLIVHVADAQGAAAFAEITPLGQRLMQACWPGPVSVVLPRRPGMASAAAAHQATVALRCPSHPVAQALLRQCLARGVPGLAAPSANRFGKVSPTRAAHVMDEFGPALLVLDGGPCEAGIESAIVDATGETPRLLRPGTLSRDVLAQRLQQALGDGGAGAPRVSGTLASHYAPDAAVQLLARDDVAVWAQHQASRPGTGPEGVPRVALWSAGPPAVQGILWRQMPDDPADAAQQLFERLRDWDQQGVAVIGIECPPGEPAWEGVHDRLVRAGAPRP